MTHRPPSQEFTLLEQRIATLEATARAGHLNDSPADDTAPQGQVTSVSTTPNTLLLGDVNLKNLRMCDLSNKCKIRTLHEANLDLIKAWVQEKLAWVPASCVIYGGLFDLLDDAADTETIINNLSALIYELRNKNENMAIYVCQLVPSVYSESMQEKTSDLNAQISKWSEINSISIINPEPAFRLGTGEVDEACYDLPGEYQGTLINRLEATRLLTAIGKHNGSLRTCIDWENLKKNQIAFNTSERRSSAPASRHPHPPHHNQDSDGWQVVARKRRRSGRSPAPDHSSGADSSE